MGEWIGFLATGSNGNRQVLGNKAVEAGEKEKMTQRHLTHLSQQIPLSRILSSISFSFWEKERFILARDSPGVAELNC